MYGINSKILQKIKFISVGFTVKKKSDIIKNNTDILKAAREITANLILNSSTLDLMRLKESLRIIIPTITPKRYNSTGVFNLISFLD